jgi:hypothetical protein
VDQIVMDKLPPNIRAQIEEFKRKATHNEALSKEYRDKYDRTHTPNQPTYEQWLKDNGKQRLAKGGSSNIKEMRDYILQREGTHGAKRLERASDEIPNLHKMYDMDALKKAFSGDNARALATLNPKDFEKYAMPLPMSLASDKAYFKEGARNPTMRQAFESSGLTNEQWHSLTDSQKMDVFNAFSKKMSKMRVNQPMDYDQYIKHLGKLKGGFNDVPFLQLNKQEAGLPITPHISGHEGRHRSRALSAKGVDKSLVQIIPRAELREPFPRRSNDEYLDALRKEMGMTNNMVRPEDEDKYGNGQITTVKRPPIQLPDFYADGGNVQGNQMDTSSIAQMRMELNQRSNPDFVDNIGINEAMDMSPKMYMNPDPKHNGFPAIGGVSDRNGLPVGGTDQNPNEPGQQIMPTPPAPPPQEGQQGQLGGGQPPQGMPPQGMAPQGPTPPMGNMLSMTPQGQTMGAMAPNPTGGMAKGGKVNPKQMAAIRAKMMMHKNKKKKIVFFDKGGEVDDPKYVPTSNPKRILFSAKGHGDVQGIVVPRHMWEGSTGAGRKVEGMKDINKARAEVYGSEKRAPLTIGQVGKAHKEHLKEHFAKPMEQQIADEKEALGRLRKAKHIGHGSNTLDESEKLDTVRHERDPEGRAYVGFASKGVAGHSLYTSGHGEHEEHHAINTCPGQTVGCGGGHDKHGIIDTSKGTCFAPNAESQYVNAAIRRASHEQAKHDPKMTKDWILAHTHSLRNAANTADKKNLVTLFRPNVVDETDVSSRHVIKGLNKQRKADDKPLIVANSYGKTNELHDPENGYHVTHSNVGPKTKHGSSIAENISRDRQRIRSTIGATDASGRDFVNEEGDKTPPKNSYLVTDVKRNSPLSKEMERHIKHAKYWSAGRHPKELAPEEHEEGEEGHYNGKGESVPEHKSHYGHMTFEGKRYDYQRQHILHPRLVQVGKNEDGTPHMIPTDSRFKDEEFLPKNRYMTKNGKKAGAILMTTPTESTSNHLHHSSFTHHVNEGHVARAKKNNGEYEIDSPLHQVMSEGKEYVAPQPINIVRKAVGGSIRKEYDDDFNAFPERNFMAQHHLTKRLGVKEEHDFHPSLLHRAED